jgi:hypothetical protein
MTPVVFAPVTGTQASFRSTIVGTMTVGAVQTYAQKVEAAKLEVGRERSSGATESRGL